MEAQQFSNPNAYPNLLNLTNSMTIEDQDHDEPKHEESKTSKKAMLAQCCAVLAIFLINFGYRSFTPIIGIDATQFHCAITYLGVILGGVMAQIVGGRIIIMLGGSALAVGWLTVQCISLADILTWVTNIVVLFAAMMQAPCLVYLAEIAQPNMRSSFVATMYLPSLFGLQFQLLLPRILPWTNVVLCIAGVVMMAYLPDSPYWLANKERYNQVESSLAWFRGWTTPAHVKFESTSIINAVQNNQQKSFLLPIVIIIYASIIRSYTAYTAFYNLAGIIESSPNYDIKILLCDIFPILFSIVFVVIVAYADKRRLVLIALLAAFFTLVFASFFDFINDMQFFTNENVEKCKTWVVIIGCAVAIYFFHVGVVQLPLLLNAELFPSKLRNVGAGIGLVFISSSFGSMKLYLGTVFSVFEFYTGLEVICMIGFISLAWILQENKYKSLVEIEESPKLVNNWRRKS